MSKVPTSLDQSGHSISILSASDLTPLAPLVTVFAACRQNGGPVRRDHGIADARTSAPRPCFPAYRNRLDDTASEVTLGRRIRQLTRGRDLIFHGTRFGQAILKENRFRKAPCGDIVVSFARSPEMAAYWALLPRIEAGAEPQGTVFVIDRIALKSRYRVVPFHDPIWDTSTSRNDETEDRVWYRDIVRLELIVAAVIWEFGDVFVNPRLWGQE